VIRGIIFDKDGTLFDFQASWADWTARLLDRYARGDAEGLQALAARIGFDPVSRRFQPGSVVIAGTPQDMASRAERPKLSDPEGMINRSPTE
jgi:phosphoglycolate phosphatase